MARIKTKDGYEYNDFQKSNRSLSLGRQLESAEKNMPKIQDYDKKYASMADDAMNRILNRKDFEYDMNADALYNQYKDQYIRSGKRAMQDTIAANNQAAGAYGNTYGVTAASQAYQNYLLGLNDKIPELYALAESRYNKEGEDLYNKYGLLSGRDETEYGRQGDLVSQAQNDRNYYYNAEADSYNRDYNAWGNDRDFGYNGYRNGISDNQWQSQFDESKRQYDTSLAEQQRQYDSNLAYQREQAAYDNAIALMKASIGSTSGGNSTNSLSGGASITPKSSKRTEAFIRHIASHRGNVTTDYISDQLDKWARGYATPDSDGKNVTVNLSDEEVAYLMNYYNIPW